MKKTMFLISALACIVSCDKGQIPSGEPEEIAFTINDSFLADVSTKASEVTGAGLTRFYAAATSGLSSESVLWQGKEFSLQAGGSKYTCSNVYWPGAECSIHFYASNLNPSVASSGAVTVSATNTTDVICANNSTPVWKSVTPLVFEHIFARVGKVTVYAPSGYNGNSISVKIRPLTGGTYNLKTKDWTDLTTASSDVIITNRFDGYGTDPDLYLVPGDYTVTATYTISKGTYSQEYTKTATVYLAPGKKNLISATLPAGDAADLEFTVTVKAWEENNITATF